MRLLWHAGDLLTTLLLIELGADPDATLRGKTKAHLYAMAGMHGQAKALLQCGADPNAKTPKGQTVLQLLEMRPDIVAEFRRPNESPERIARAESQVRQISNNFRELPEKYVFSHPNVLIWSYGAMEGLSPEAQGWARRVKELLREPQLMAGWCETNLQGSALNEMCRRISQDLRHKGREQTRKRMRDEYRALYYP